MALNVGEVIATLKADTSQFTTGINAANNKLDQLGKSIQQSNSRFTAFLKSGIITSAGAVITSQLTEPLIGVAKSAILAADQLEQASIAYTTLLGSGEAAQKMMNEMRAFAASTPFEFPELLEAGKRLLAMGFNAKQIIPVLTNVGNAVAGVGGNVGVMNRVILAMGQIQAKGQLLSGEMRQLAEAGIPAWEFLAKFLNVTIPEAMDMVTKKQVSGAQAITALQAGMAAKFGGMMEQQSQTITGVFSNLNDTLGFILTEIGVELVKTLNLKEIIGNIRDFAQSFLTWFQSLDDGTKRTILVLTGAFAAGGPILVAVGAFMAAMTVITAPMLATGAIITGIVAGVGVIIANWTSLKNRAIAIWTGLRDGVVKIATDTYTGIKTYFVDKLMAIVQPVQQFSNNVLGIFKQLRYELVGGSEVPDMVKEIGDHMRMLDKNMSAPARVAAQGTWDVFRDLSGKMDTVSRQMATTMVSVWTSTSNSISNALATQLIKGNDWKATMESISISVLSTFLNLGIQLIAQKGLQLAVWTAQNAGILAGESTTAAGVVSIWTAATASVTGALGAMTGAIAAFFTGTIIPMFATVGEVVMTFLSAIATSLDISIFGAPFSIPVWAAVGLVAAAVGVISAFSFGAFAEGGIVQGPMMGLVGEAGPEAIIPLSQLASMGFGGGQQTVIVELDGKVLTRSVFDNMGGTLRIRGVRA